MALDFEKQFYCKDIKLIVGVDEAGRGCLLGPVFAGAVILPPNFSSNLINDSKKLSEKKRIKAYQEIVNNAIAWGVGSCSPEEIDELNILNASREAMYRAIDNMHHHFDMVISDFMKMPMIDKPVVALVHGDAKSLCVAAASIIAKVTRDRTCYKLDALYPLYNIKDNKGYGTKKHLEALEKYGPIKGLHRFSYKPVQSSLIKKVSLL